MCVCLFLVFIICCDCFPLIFTELTQGMLVNILFCFGVMTDRVLSADIKMIHLPNKDEGYSFNSILNVVPLPNSDDLTNIFPL